MTKSGDSKNDTFPTQMWKSQFITIMQNMNSGNHRILYKCPHPDFFRMFTLCFCFNQNVSPLISPWFRNSLFPVPPSLSCQWSVLGDTVCARAKVGPQARIPTEPGTAGWSSTHATSDPCQASPSSWWAQQRPLRLPGCLRPSPMLLPLELPPQVHLHPQRTFCHESCAQG